MTRLTVIVPLYNEGGRVEATALAILEHFGSGLHELLLVDDGSTDGTGEVVKRLSAVDPRVRGAGYDLNRGKGFAVRTGLQLATGDEVLFTDCDLSTPLEEYARLHQALLDGADVASGSRALDPALLTVHQPKYREVLGRAANRLLRRIDPHLGGFRDTQCGFKLFRAAPARFLSGQQTIERWGFDFELLHVAVKHGLRVAEVPVRWAHSGTSSLKPTDYLRTLGELVRVIWNDARGRYDDAPPT